MSEHNIHFYSKVAEQLISQYESVEFERVHAAWHHLLPQSGWALDVGAGSGRDATYLAQKGFSVVAVEPANVMRELGQKIHAQIAIHWLNDTLPELKKVYALQIKFDLILVSAVWMHIPASERQRAFRKLANLLNPGGKLVITLRHGEFTDERTAFPVSIDEINRFAAQQGLVSELNTENEHDALKRSNVSWQTVVCALPDDGSGAFPVLRHVTINDKKSSTYKLGLLRSLLRIAEAHPGSVIETGDTWVDLPLGLVAFYWLKLYRPLVDDFNIKQSNQKNKGLGFIKNDGWRALGSIKNTDLFISAIINDRDLAKSLTTTLKQIASTIKAMPATFMTYPGTDVPIFEVEVKRVSASSSLVLNFDYFRQFGVMRVPVSIWNTLSKFSVWIEPAIVNEWSYLQLDYAKTLQIPLTESVSLAALRWHEPEHNTQLARKRAVQLAQMEQLFCVWSGRRLLKSGPFAIDHTMPFARWPNNDLWNLVPANERLNRIKSDKLPGMKTLIQSRQDIIDWWKCAWENDSNTFYTQARLALPGLNAIGLNHDDVFDALIVQRDRIRSLQQLPEWECKR